MERRGGEYWAWHPQPRQGSPDEEKAVTRAIERQNVLGSNAVDAAVVPGHGQILKLRPGLGTAFCFTQNFAGFCVAHARGHIGRRFLDVDQKIV